MGVLICCITAPMDLNFTKLTFSYNKFYFIIPWGQLTLATSLFWLTRLSSSTTLEFQGSYWNTWRRPLWGKYAHFNKSRILIYSLQYLNIYMSLPHYVMLILITKSHLLLALITVMTSESSPFAAAKKCIKRHKGWDCCETWFPKAHKVGLKTCTRSQSHTPCQI